MNDTNTVKDKVDLEVDIQELFLVIWGKKYQILLTTFVFAVASIIYSLSLSNYFQSESILVSKDSSKSSSSLGQYSDLAALAGFSLETGDNKVFETIEIIKSREFVKHLLSFENILPSLMAAKSYDKETNKLFFKEKIFNSSSNEWKGNSFRYGANKPSYLEVHKVYLSQLNIFQDKKSNFVNISYEHISPTFARDFLLLIIREANNLMRQRDLDESNNAITYLKEEFNRTFLKEIKLSIQSLIEFQLETQMRAKISEEYSLSVLEPPYVPELKSRPKRSLIVISFTLIGFIITSLSYLIFHFIKIKKDLKNQ